MLRKIFTVFLVIIFGIPAFTVSAQIPNSPDAISVLGQADFASGTSGLSDTKLNGPNGIAVDPFTGKVFVADRSNHRVLRWASDDALNSGAAAEAVLGQVDFTSNSSGLTAGKFNNPIGVHIDQQGRLWVGDFGNKRVLRFDNAAQIPTGSLADGVLGQPDFTTNSNGNSAEKLGGPVGLYVDYTGTLWVSDWSNHRVVFYSNAAALPNGSAANAVLGQADFGLAVSATTQTGMKNPNDVYVDIAGRLWVSDAANRRVLRFDNARNLSNGAPADGVLGQTDFNSDVSAVTQSGFTNLRFVTGDNSGRLYVIQENSHRIVVFEQAAFLPNGAPADYIWGQPDFNTGSAGNPVSASNYNTPRAMYVDEARGNIWVADYNNHRVLRYEINFFNSLLIGNNPMGVSVLGQADFASGTSGLSDTKLNGPNGVAVDPFTGKVFVADRSNHRVLRWASDVALNSGAAAEAVLGQVDFTSNSSGLTAGKFNNPIGVHIDQQGRLWVGDFGNKRVLRFDNAAQIPTGSLADGVLGQPDFTTNSNGNSAEKLGGPVGLYVDYTGTLWVSDWSNHRVVFYANAAALPNGSAANAVLGQADFGLAVSATTQTGMKNPNDVYVDIAGRLWVSDAANRRVLRFDNARNLPNGAPADGVLGQADFNSDVSAVTQSGFTNLRFVTGDNSGRLYVIQENSHRIVVFEQAAFLPNGAPADYIWGQPDFNTGSAGNPVSASNYNTPRAMYVDEARGNIWVADYSNHRVIRYYFINSGQYQVQLLSPSGGESWAQQTVQQITWTSSLVDKVKIEFSENGGADYIILADSVSASEEVFNWLITSDLTTQAKIRISDISNPSISSESDLFSIVPLTNIITLISPDGFQQWEQNSDKFIMFTVENIDFLKIEFSINNGSDWTTIEENYPTSDGKYLWNLPDLVSDQCLVKLTDIVSGSTAISEYPFSIVEETEANQDIIFFSDSPTPVFYDPSWGTVTAPSTLEIIGSKWPVSTNYALIGNYSLKLNYKSVTGGNWAIAVASPGWLGHDFSVMDTLSIRVFSENGWSSAIMPFIYLEDLSNRKTEKIPLESLVGSIEPNMWTELRIPVQVFIDNPLTADLTRIKTIFFGQHHADDTQHTIYLDDIRVEGEDINGNDRPVFVILGSSTAAGAGASGSATSWVGLFRTYVQSINPEAVVVNLAVGGFTTYHVMPTGFIPPSGRPMPSSNNNITRALTYNPWAIIINLPSNDAANNYSVTEQMENFETIINLSTSSEVDYRVTTTQPRNFTNPDQLQNLFAVRTAILDTYTTKAVNIFDELAQPDGTIKPIYNSGDGIHLNDAGHAYIYQEIIGSGVANVLSQSEINQDNKSEMFNMAYPNPAANFINFMFDLPKHSEVSINLYNTLGQKAIGIPSEMYSEGKQNISLNISTLPAGVYVYQISIRNSDFINTYGKTISVIK